MVVQSLIAKITKFFSKSFRLLSHFFLVLDLDILCFELESVLHLQVADVSVLFQLLVVFGFFPGTFERFFDFRA